MSKDLEFDYKELKMLIHEDDAVYFSDTKLDYVIDVLGKGRFQLLKI